MVLKRCQMFLFEPSGEDFQGIHAALQMQLIGLCQGADIEQLEGLIQKTTEGRLGEPAIEGHRVLFIGMRFLPLFQQLLNDDQFAVIELPDLRVTLLPSLPDPQQVAAPLLRIGVFQDFFAGFDRDLSCRMPWSSFSKSTGSHN